LYYSILSREVNWRGVKDEWYCWPICIASV